MIHICDVRWMLELLYYIKKRKNDIYKKNTKQKTNLINVHSLIAHAFEFAFDIIFPEALKIEIHLNVESRHYFLVNERNILSLKSN